MPISLKARVRYDQLAARDWIYGFLLVLLHIPDG